MYASIPIRGLLKGHLLISLKLKDILNEAKETIQITNPDYDIVIKHYICIMIWN